MVSVMVWPRHHRFALAGAGLRVVAKNGHVRFLGPEISRVMELRYWYVTKYELNMNKHAT
jgi:hypothetical protein